MLIGLKSGADTGITINIRPRGQPKYRIRKCFEEYEELALPEGKEHVWTFSSTRHRLTVICNGVTVIDYVVGETAGLECRNTLQSVKMISIKHNDTATDLYRPDPKS